MKQMNFIGLALLGTLLGCSNGEQKSEASANADTLSAKSSTIESHEVVQTGSDQLIVPGQSIGQLRLGQDIQEVVKLLGKVDDGDAAMGKAWGIWRQKNTNGTTGDISVYSSYRDTAMVVKDVKQIVVSAASFATKEGLHAGSSLAEIKAVFPEVKEVERYVKGKDTLMIYDALNAGIGFDLQRSEQGLKSVAITVHSKKVAINSTYLTIHPGWKKVSVK